MQRQPAPPQRCPPPGPSKASKRAIPTWRPLRLGRCSLKTKVPLRAGPAPQETTRPPAQRSHATHPIDAPPEIEGQHTKREEGTPTMRTATDAHRQSFPKATREPWARVGSTRRRACRRRRRPVDFVPVGQTRERCGRRLEMWSPTQSPVPQEPTTTGPAPSRTAAACANQANRLLFYEWEYLRTAKGETPAHDRHLNGRRRRPSTAICR